MKLKVLSVFFSLQFFCLIILAQNGPGGIGNTSGNSNLQLWLTASDLITSHNNGDPVLQWNDKSGAGNDVFSAASVAPVFTNPINNNPGVEFQGSHYMQTNGTSNSFSNPKSTIFLVKSGAYNGTSIAVASAGWENEMLLFDHKQYHHSSSGNFKHIAHPCIENIPANDVSIICGVFGKTPTDLRYIVNGYESSEPILSAGGSWNYQEIDRKVTLGQRDQLVWNEYFEGTLLEVIVYNNKLTDSEILSVENYLRCTYDITPSTCSNLSNDGCQTNPNTCGIPQNISHELQAPARCNITWTAVPNVLMYDVHYRIKGTGPENWTRRHSFNTIRSLHYLQQNTTYEYFVRATCDGTWDFSESSPRYEFQTHGIADLREGMTDAFELYPNPASDQLIIEYFDSNSSENTLEGKIYNVDGKEMKIFHIENGSPTTLNIEEIPTGIYIIKINGEYSRLIVR